MTAPCLFVSIPPEEEATARRHMPAAWLTQRALADLDGHDHPGVRVLGVMVCDDVTPQRLERFVALQALVTRSDGTDHLPLAWLAKRGVRAYGLAGYATQSVARVAVAHLLALARRIPEAARAPGGPAPRWDRPPFWGATWAG